jgi:hypothetical protein
MKAAASEGASVEERHDPLTGMPRFEEPNWTIVPVQRSTMRAL